MKKAVEIINYIVVFCLMIAAAIVLAVSSVTTIYYDMHCENDWPKYGRENIPLLVISVAAVLLVFYLIYRAKLFEKSRYFIIAALVFITVYCLMLILVIYPQAVNDSKTLDDIINEFMSGNYTSLTEKGGYLFIWPFQLGYVALGQLMGRIFGYPYWLPYILYTGLPVRYLKMKEWPELRHFFPSGHFSFITM